jgi:hypothetical protein
MLYDIAPDIIFGGFGRQGPGGAAVKNGVGYDGEGPPNVAEATGQGASHSTKRSMANGSANPSYGSPPNDVPTNFLMSTSLYF